MCSAHSVLEKLKITPSEQSKDYVENKTQFQLHNLLTEQRHPKTWNLSYTIKENTQAGLEALLSVDLDVSNKLTDLSKDTSQLEQAAKSIEKAIVNNKKIYIYGCGSTGRLAKQVESSFWRPFWNKLKNYSFWERIQDRFSGIENALIGEMTGADRALISSLEGFEDLQLIGKCQLEGHGIEKGDVVFAITEGGETSSVIGTILAARKQYHVDDADEASKNLYFIFNNPDEVLMPFERSRSVLVDDAISKIRLYTGPQSIT
jgi:phosphoheptose isomerase